MYLIFKTSTCTYTLVYNPILVLLMHHVEYSIAIDIEFAQNIIFIKHILYNVLNGAKKYDRNIINDRKTGTPKI